eukprot:g18004.t1
MLRSTTRYPTISSSAILVPFSPAPAKAGPAGQTSADMGTDYTDTSLDLHGEVICPECHNADKPIPVRKNLKGWKIWLCTNPKCGWANVYMPPGTAPGQPPAAS